jgi:FkbM family methyltransferase
MLKMKIKDGLKTILAKSGFKLVRIDRRWGIDVYDDIRRIIKDEHDIVAVFDVGANDGVTALRMSREYPSAKVYSFEPVSSTFKKLKASTEACDRIKCYQMGLGNFIGTAACSIHADDHKNTIVEGLTDQLHSHPIGDELIQIGTLDDMVAKLQILSIDLLKIDTEGSDLAVLQGASNSLARNLVKFIYFEFHYLLPPKATRKLGNLVDIANFLDGFGYRFITVYTDSVHGHENIGTYNCLFMLDNGRYSWQY